MRYPDPASSSIDSAARAGVFGGASRALGFLVPMLVLTALIVAANFVIGAITPITLWAEDDMSLIDGVWRLVQGQHLGVDFYDPRGFGVFQVAAWFWHLLGPHFYVLRLSNDLFALLIVACGCWVASRRLRHVPGLGALFCLTIAFEASCPAIYGLVRDFGMAITYDRLLMAGMGIIFVQSFVGDPAPSDPRGRAIDLLVMAFLLNLLFLVKISGPILGLAMLVAGYIVRGQLRRGLRDIPLLLVLLAILIAVDFLVTGNNPRAVFESYQIAAQARKSAASILNVVLFASRTPVVGSVVLLILYLVSRPTAEKGAEMWRCLLVIGSYWGSQVVLNISNGTLTNDLIYLAPAAAVALSLGAGESHAVAFWTRPWARFHPRRLHHLSARDAVPLLLIGLILVPEVRASLTGLKLDLSIAMGLERPTTITAGKGVTFNVITTEDYVLGFARGVRALESIGATREKIANLDFMNPFPALFLNPDPGGVWAFWDFGYNVPESYQPRWQEILGDACVVTEPAHPVPITASARLAAAVEPHLASAFDLVYRDEFWKIWKHRGSCPAPGGGSAGSR